MQWFLAYDNCSLNTGLLENFKLFQSTSKVPLNTGAGISLSERLLNVLSWVTFGAVNWWALVQSVGAFITNGNFNSQDSILFWLKFFATCDEQAAERFQCGTGGLGFFTALWVQVLVWAFITFAIAYMFPGSGSLITWLWIAFFVFFPTFAYMQQPICTMLFPIPILPPTLADDIFYIFMIFYGDCFPWYRWFPGITTPICPTEAQGFTRAFVNGNDEPYRFDLGFRAFFFLLKWQWPSAYTFIGETQFFLFSWPLGISGIREAYDNFPWPTGTQPPDVWISLFKIYWPTLAFPFVIIIFSIFAILILFLVIRAIFIFIAASLALVGTYAGDFMGGSTGTYQDPKRVYNDATGAVIPNTGGSAAGSGGGSPYGPIMPSSSRYAVTRGPEDHINFLHDPVDYYASYAAPPPSMPHPPPYPPPPSQQMYYYTMAS